MDIGIVRYKMIVLHQQSRQGLSHLDSDTDQEPLDQGIMYAVLPPSMVGLSEPLK